MNEFEKQWLNKLKKELFKLGREDLFEKCVENHDSSVQWTENLMNSLNSELSQEEVKKVMCGCACLAPKDYLKKLQENYKKHKNLNQVHQLLQEYFIKFIKEYKNLNDEQLNYIQENNMGMAGSLKENVITAVKIPKEFQEFLLAKDETEKRFHYCHCPRIRETLKSNEKPVDKNYCYCGAGFYRDIWEYILQRPVEVNMVESIMNGDEFCRIEIRI